MNPFAYLAPSSIESALGALSPTPDTSTAEGSAKFIAGGTNLLDLMKENVMRPASLIDINALPLDSITETSQGGLLLGALARNAETAYHPAIQENYPLLAAAILAGATPQIRNMASNGGNLLQRTRCYYFYDTATPCNKRNPGSGCSALHGLSRIHAILGTSQHCVATHPSDMCIALAALDAQIHVRSSAGSRIIPFQDFHRLPGEQPDRDNTLAPDEMITHIELPPARQLAGHSAYLKLRDRASYAFALVSVAAALDLDENGKFREARLALGGVAHRPWRKREAEDVLRNSHPAFEHFTKAADILLDGAKSCGAEEGNAFKIPLAKRAIVRALKIATEGTVRNSGRDTASGHTASQGYHP